MRPNRPWRRRGFPPLRRLSGSGGSPEKKFAIAASIGHGSQERRQKSHHEGSEDHEKNFRTGAFADFVLAVLGGLVVVLPTLRLLLENRAVFEVDPNEIRYYPWRGAQTSVRWDRVESIDVATGISGLELTIRSAQGSKVRADQWVPGWQQLFGLIYGHLEKAGKQLILREAMERAGIPSGIHPR
jgi:hypothetical protein